MQNLEYGDGWDLFPMVWKGFLYILCHTRQSGRLDRPRLDICPNFRSFFGGDPSLSQSLPPTPKSWAKAISILGGTYSLGVFA